MLKFDNGIFEAVFPFFRAEAVETYGEFAETEILPKTTTFDNGIFEIESSFFYAEAVETYGELAKKRRL